MIRLQRLRPIIRKEFAQVSRDKRTLGVLLVIPAFMLIMFGYALNYDVRNVPIAVLDQDQTQLSRDFLSSVLESGYFHDVARLAAIRDARTALSGRLATAVVVIPRGFAKSIDANRPTQIQVLLDGANAMTAGTVASYLAAITQTYSTNLTIATLGRNGIQQLSLPLDFRPRIWYNPELKSAKFLVPGLIGFILMLSTVISTSLSIVREKENGTIEQIIVSPIHPLELLLGKTLPYVGISLVSTALILVVGYFLFDVVISGSIVLLFVVTLLFILCGLGTGVFVSTTSNTQEEAFMLSATVAMLPTFMLSGFAFPIRNMPEVIQWITYLNPARYFLTCIRDIILKGVGMEVVWPEALFMTAFAIVIIAVSWNKMRRQLG